MRLAEIKKIPANARGVYAFTLRTNGKCIYIGKAESQSIRTRLEQHWRQSHNPKLAQWLNAFGDVMEICYISVDARKVDRVESFFIGTWHPETNSKLQRR